MVSKFNTFAIDDYIVHDIFQLVASHTTYLLLWIYSSNNIRHLHTIKTQTKQILLLLFWICNIYKNKLVQWDQSFCRRKCLA